MLVALLISILLNGAFSQESVIFRDYYLISGYCQNKQDIASIVRLRIEYKRINDRFGRFKDVNFHIIEAIDPEEVKYWSIYDTAWGFSSESPDVTLSFCWLYQRNKWSEHGCSKMTVHPNDEIEINKMGGTSKLCKNFRTGLREISSSSL